LISRFFFPLADKPCYVLKKYIKNDVMHIPKAFRQRKITSDISPSSAFSVGLMDFATPSEEALLTITES
jgi:hypothetical protein